MIEEEAQYRGGQPERREAGKHQLDRHRERDHTEFAGSQYACDDRDCESRSGQLKRSAEGVDRSLPQQSAPGSDIGLSRRPGRCRERVGRLELAQLGARVLSVAEVQLESGGWTKIAGRLIVDE